MSAESGVPTFRGDGGLWHGFRPEELATPAGFRRNPEVVWSWYRWRRDIVLRAVPHAGYDALRRLAESRIVHVVTQNVDGLHERTASADVVELHGSIHRTRCTREGCNLGRGVVPDGSGVPTCACGEILRPDVVWFGEGLPAEALRRSHESAASVDCALVIGTSSLVYPAAALPFVARDHGAKIIEINVEETPLSAEADWSLRGTAGTLLPELVRGALEG